MLVVIFLSQVVKLSQTISSYRTFIFLNLQWTAHNFSSEIRISLELCSLTEKEEGCVVSETQKSVCCQVFKTTSCVEKHVLYHTHYTCPQETAL